LTFGRTRRRRARAISISLWAASMLAAPAALAQSTSEPAAKTASSTFSTLEPWSDGDPAGPKERLALGDHYGLKAGAEYRANWLYVNPISLNTPSDRKVSWIEHRLRLDATLDFDEKIRLVVSVDALDGALWGDNGDFGGAPSSNTGLNVGARNPNVTQPCVVYRSGDPLQPSGYGYGLCEQDQIRFRRVYGEAITPVGLIRVGRQPANLGTGVQAADGDGRPNRFGFSRQGNNVDRILFATKPLEGFKPVALRDKSDKRGLFFVLTYDRLATDSPRLFGDDVNQISTAARFLAPDYGIGRDLLIATYFVHRWDRAYTSRVNSLGMRAMSRFGSVQAGFDIAYNFGTTREISTAYSKLTNDPPRDQPLRQLGARGVVRYDQPLFTAYLEFDYASGDRDPQTKTDLTQFTFAEDTNVGLLLFKHVLAFQSARSAARGVELLRRLGATTFPAEAVNTRGAFTNAIALFPQVDVRPHPKILLRGGALFAWASTPVVDPVGSLQARDGNHIEDDLVNFAGGKPARYYGTELDGRFQWRYLDHLYFDLEGAILFPGEGLKNADGQAAKSVLVQGRTTFVF
jgi:hypothetical protein